MERRYQHFQPVLEAYLQSAFSATIVDRYGQVRRRKGVGPAASRWIGFVDVSGLSLERRTGLGLTEYGRRSGTLPGSV